MTTINMIMHDKIVNIIDKDDRIKALNDQYDHDRFESDEVYEEKYYNELTTLRQLIINEMFGNQH